ncbi:MAG: hypothetical protein LBT40_00485 [Deltaproteobacteria bacterium]|nr:hypothetical protein [Deltaproteobacteria bacterium]
MDDDGIARPFGISETPDVFIPVVPYAGHRHVPGPAPGRSPRIPGEGLRTGPNVEAGCGSPSGPAGTRPPAFGEDLPGGNDPDEVWGGGRLRQ